MILVPTDFSPLAEHALAVAAEISRKTSAEITLIHVVESSHHYGTFASSGEQLHEPSINDLFFIKSIEQAKKRFKKIMDDIRYVGICFHTKIRIGHIDKHLYESFIHEHASLIVMGTKGSTGFFKGIFNSSYTEEVVMHAECMVLTIKENTQLFNPKNAILATDFIDYSPAFIHKLLDLQDLFHFKLHLLYVDSTMKHKTSAKIETDKELFLSKFNIREYECHILQDSSQYSAILDYAQKADVGMIALSTHQRNGFWHWLGGLSEDLVHYAQIPVLTYKAKQ